MSHGLLSKSLLARYSVRLDHMKPNFEYFIVGGNLSSVHEASRVDARVEPAGEDACSALRRREACGRGLCQELMGELRELRQLGE